MPKVTGVRLRYSKTLWFNPGELDPQEGAIVIVETERGQEVGLVQHPVHDVDEGSLKAALKPVLRIATKEDMEHVVALGEKEKAAMPKFKELIEKNHLEMKPVDIEYLFGGDKIVFYFSAEERVDFRALVKDLASHFHMRIDMRQVGVRDEARMVGGLGHCGEVLCCSRMGGEFAPVSIKMAKDQGLPLNPLKISGRCGRLMCCLRYEVEAYQDFNARSPRKNAIVDTPRGESKVVDIDALREIITLQFQRQEDEGPDRLAVPLCKMNCTKEGKKCACTLTEDAYNELTEEKEKPVDPFFFPTPSFKTLDAGPEAGKPTKGAHAKHPNAKNNTPKTASSEKKDGSNRTKRKRRPNKNNKPAEESKATPQQKEGEQQTPRSSRNKRRRGGKGRSGAAKTSEQRSTQKPPSARTIEAGQRIPRRRNRNKEE